MDSMKTRKKIEIKGNKIEYNFKKNRRAKRLRLCVRRGGELVVSAPWRMPIWVAEKFLYEKSDWILSKIELMKKFFPEEKDDLGSGKKYLEAKKETLSFVREKVEKLNQFYGFPVGKISVRRQKSRWGSCSKKGNLSFNLKINKIPEKYAEYIVVHELCHIGEFNHSEKFWQLVEKTIPDYASIRKELRKM
jgi:predicted metal-dependent hydrolase